MTHNLLRPLSHPWFKRPGVATSVLRLDQLHPIISGNKYFKLLHNIADANACGHTAILTFGGPFSNHLHASAAMAQSEGLQSIGLVRGLYAGSTKTKTLLDCEAMGMALHGLSRADYARREEPNFLQEIRARFGSPFIIPEGGSNAAGRAGASRIAGLIPEGTTHACTPIGTGTTLAGLRAALDARIMLLGFPAFRNAGYIVPEINRHLPPALHNRWTLVEGFAEGGFAKTSTRLNALMNRAFDEMGLPLDRVYTGKMMLGLRELIADGFFPEGSRIVAIHTGGMQGNQPGDLPSSQSTGEA